VYDGWSNHQKVIEVYNPQIRINNAPARAIGERVGLENIDAENAMRHCVGQCEYARVAYSQAVIAGLYHEAPEVPSRFFRGGGVQNGPFGSNYRDSLKDSYNNSCGRDNSTKPKSCFNSCSESLASGRLATDLNGPALFPVASRRGIDSLFCDDSFIFYERDKKNHSRSSFSERRFFFFRRTCR